MTDYSPPLLNDKLAAALGQFLVAFSTVETVLEVGIAKLLNLDPQRASIVTGGLAFKARTTILSSLLHLDEKANKDAIAALKKLTSRGERNHIAHAVIAYSSSRVKFYHRQVQERLKVREKNFDANQLFALAVEFGEFGAKLQECLGISSDDISDFFNAVHNVSHK